MTLVQFYLETFDTDYINGGEESRELWMINMHIAALLERAERILTEEAVGQDDASAIGALISESRALLNVVKWLRAARDRIENS